MEVYWLDRKEDDVPGHDEWLSANERAAACRFHNAKRRADWRLGRWTAKNALLLRLGIPALFERLSEVEVCPDPSGAPRLLHRQEAAPYAVSLSHSAGAAMCALAEPGALLGCDLERIEPRSPSFLAEFFGAEEQHCILACDNSDRDAMVAALWSAKESVLKALGCGLQIDPSRIPIGLATALPDGQWNHVSVSLGRPQAFDGWWRLESGFAWTIVSFPSSTLPIHL